MYCVVLFNTYNIKITLYIALRKRNEMNLKDINYKQGVKRLLLVATVVYMSLMGLHIYNDFHYTKYGDAKQPEISEYIYFTNPSGKKYERISNEAKARYGGECEQNDALCNGAEAIYILDAIEANNTKHLNVFSVIYYILGIPVIVFLMLLITIKSINWIFIGFKSEKVN